MTDPPADALPGLTGPTDRAGGRVSTQSRRTWYVPSCARWGEVTASLTFDTDDPDCSCPMCTVRRADRARGAKNRGRR